MFCLLRVSPGLQRAGILLVKRLKMAKFAEDSPELVFATLMMPHLELDLYVSKGRVPVPTDAISGSEGEAQTYDNHHDHYNWPYVRQ